MLSKADWNIKSSSERPYPTNIDMRLSKLPKQVHNLNPKDPSKNNALNTLPDYSTNGFDNSVFHKFETALESQE